MLAKFVFFVFLVVLTRSSAFLSSASFSATARRFTVQYLAFPWFGGGNENNDESKEATSANLGNVASVMDSMASFKKSQRIEERTSGVLQDLSNIFIDGSSADGKVKVTYNGQQKPVGVQIDVNYFQSLKNDKAGSEELSMAIQQAIQEAHEKSTVKMEEKMKNLYQDIGFETS
jgi:DNA-binding protein YbaB